MEGTLSGRIISGSVRVGLGTPVGTRGLGRTRIVNFHMERMHLVGEFLHACQQPQIGVANVHRSDTITNNMAIAVDGS